MQILTNEANKIEALTFTRFIAALSIVVIHYGQSTYPFNVEGIAFLFGSSNIAVSYFFALSGFVMMLRYGSAEKINPLEFYKNRFAKIYPVYLLSILFLLCVLLALHQVVDANGMILNVLGLQSWFPGYACSFNYPAWSLSVEFLFYLLFPWLFNYFYSRYSLKTILMAILGVWVLSQLAVHYLFYSNFIKTYPSARFDLAYYFPPMHLNVFLMGNLGGLIFIKKFRTIKKQLDWLILLLFLVFLIILKYPQGMIFHNGLLAFIFIPILLMLSVNNGYLYKLFKLKIFLLLGEISYCLYILQYPVYKFSMEMFNYFHLDKLKASFYLYLIVLLLVSTLSYFIIEIPVKRLIKRNWLANKVPRP